MHRMCHRKFLDMFPTALFDSTSRNPYEERALSHLALLVRQPSDDIPEVSIPRRLPLQPCARPTPAFRLSVFRLSDFSTSSPVRPTLKLPPLITLFVFPPLYAIFSEPPGRQLRVFHLHPLFYRLFEPAAESGACLCVHRILPRPFEHSGLPPPRFQTLILHKFRIRTLPQAAGPLSPLKTLPFVVPFLFFLLMGQTRAVSPLPPALSQLSSLVTVDRLLLLAPFPFLASITSSWRTPLCRPARAFVPPDGLFSPFFASLVSPCSD